MPPQVVGSNVLLTSVLALLSFVPFEYVTKGSLLLAVFLFVLDPIPPTSRLLALLFVSMIGVISRLRRHWIEAQEADDDEYVVVTVEDDDATERIDSETNPRHEATKQKKN